jgi:hypothetical protein
VALLVRRRAAVRECCWGYSLRAAHRAGPLCIKLCARPAASMPRMRVHHPRWAGAEARWLAACAGWLKKAAAGRLERPP